MKISKYNFVFPFDQHYSLVYNALSRSIILLENKYAREILSGQLANILVDEELVKTLKDLYIILDEDIDERALFKYLTYSLRFSKENLLLFLSLTNRCNLACIYCYQSHRPMLEGSDLTIAKWCLMKKFVERKLQEGSKEIDVALFGGEPLLNANTARVILKDLNKLASEHGSRLRVMLVTNGTIIDDVEDVISNVDTIQITIDGTMEVHDKRRPFKNGAGSFETIFKNTLQFIDKYNKWIVIRVNVDEHNIDKLVEFVDLLDEHGLRNKIDSIDFSPVIPDQAGKYKPFKGKKTYAQY
ncbi:MAG: radical SAM protein, partial [Desulfurococcaceae archaeon]